MKLVSLMTKRQKASFLWAIKNNKRVIESIKEELQDEGLINHKDQLTSDGEHFIMEHKDISVQEFAERFM